MGGEFLMRLLLDTHAAIWWWEDSATLGARARKAMADPGNIVHFSSASAYEIHQKIRLGKLELPEDLLGDGLLRQVSTEGWQPYPLHPAEAAAAATFDHPHRDPFDLMLAAQSLLGGFTLLSRDSFFRDLGIDLLW